MSVLVVLLALLCGPGVAADWPQWRGPSGDGTSPETNLPVDLSADSPLLAWKVAVPGDGISSPIVKDGRVYLTTAYPGAMQSKAGRLKSAGVPTLAVFLLAAAAMSVLRWRPPVPLAPNPGRSRRLFFFTDSLAVGLGTAGVLGLALVAALRSDLLWTAGVPGERWLVSGCLGLAGAAVAVGWLPRGSRLRLVGAAALVVAGACLWRWLPANKYGFPYKLPIRLAMVAPAAVGAGWHAAAWLLAGGRPPARQIFRSGAAAAALAVASFLPFFVDTLWQPRAGLVRAVLCYDLETGAELWNAPVFVAPQERKYDGNSFATPTPCADGLRVFAYFGSGYGCLDLDGNVLWKAVDPSYPEKTRYGASTSPILFEDTFVVLQDREGERGASFAMALDARSGDVRWRVTPEDAVDSYTTPVLVPRPGGAELVSVTSNLLYGCDPRSGERLWSLWLPIQQMVPGISFDGDLLLVTGGTHQHHSGHGVRLRGVGAETEATTLWSTRRAIPAIASPVLYGGHFFTITDGGILVCYEPESGEVRWKERLEGNYWPSLVAGDGKIYALSSEGEITVVRASPEFEVLARARLGEPCSATPAISDGRVLVRTGAHLYCFGPSGA